MKNRRPYIVVKNPKASKREYIVIKEGRDIDKEECLLTYATKEDAMDYCVKFNSKYYLDDYTVDELKEFAKKIPWAELTNIIKNRLHLEELHLQYNLDDIYSDKNDSEWIVGHSIDVISLEDLCTTNYLLSKIFKSCYIKTFSSNIGVNSDTGVLYWSSDIDIRIINFSSGYNGASICSVYYDHNKGLKVTFEEDRFK